MPPSRQDLAAVPVVRFAITVGELRPWCQRRFHFLAQLLAFFGVRITTNSAFSWAMNVIRQTVQCTSNKQNTCCYAFAAAFLSPGSTSQRAMHRNKLSRCPV